MEKCLAKAKESNIPLVVPSIRPSPTEAASSNCVRRAALHLNKVFYPDQDKLEKYYADRIEDIEKKKDATTSGERTWPFLEKYYADRIEDIEKKKDATASGERNWPLLTTNRSGERLTKSNLDLLIFFTKSDLDTFYLIVWDTSRMCLNPI